MLDTDLETRPVRSDVKAAEAEADEELAGVFGGEGVENLRMRATWYVAGVWPFRRISFECPGCSRWLSVKSSHAARVGFCPSCQLTVAAPDPGEDLSAALVSRARGIPALPARRLPERKQPEVLPGAGEAGAEAGATQLSRDVQMLNPKREPELKRKHAELGEEEQWGLAEDTKLVPVRVVSRFQAFTPWVGLAAISACAFLVGYMFMMANQDDGGGEIPSMHEPKRRAPVPLSSELWVVLDSLATAETAEEMATLVRNPKEMLPKMQFYYADSLGKLPHRFERARPGLNVFELGEKTFARFEGICDGRPVKFSFQWTGYGWRLDWESLVGYSDMNWREFLAAKPEGDYDFRLLAKVSSGEAMRFEYDKERYVCLQLADHLETGRAYALVERAGAAGRQLEKFFRLDASGGAPRTWITPVLRWMDGSGEMLEIVDLKSASWLVP